jgi:hypothetical protein
MKLIIVHLSFINFQSYQYNKVTCSIEEEEKYPFENAIHWRRASTFLQPNENLGLKEADVFYGEIEPSDVR